MSEIADFLRARAVEIAATARAARKVGGGFWELLAHERGDGAIYDDMGTVVLMYDADDPNSPRPEQAAHIALNDPGAALDWTEAQVRLLDLLAGTPYQEPAARILAEQYRAHPDCKKECRA